MLLYIWGKRFLIKKTLKILEVQRFSEFPRFPRELKSLFQKTEMMETLETVNDANGKWVIATLEMNATFLNWSGPCSCKLLKVSSGHSFIKKIKNYVYLA